MSLVTLELWVYVRGNFDRSKTKIAKQQTKADPYILKVDSIINVGVTVSGTCSIALSIRLRSSCVGSICMFTSARIIQQSGDLCSSISRLSGMEFFWKAGTTRLD